MNRTARPPAAGRMEGLPVAAAPPAAVDGDAAREAPGAAKPPGSASDDSAADARAAPP